MREWQLIVRIDHGACLAHTPSNCPPSGDAFMTRPQPVDPADGAPSSAGPVSSRVPKWLRILLPTLLIAVWLAGAALGGPYFGRGFRRCSRGQFWGIRCVPSTGVWDLSAARWPKGALAVRGPCKSRDRTMTWSLSAVGSDSCSADASATIVDLGSMQRIASKQALILSTKSVGRLAQLVRALA